MRKTVAVGVIKRVMRKDKDGNLTSSGVVEEGQNAEGGSGAPAEEEGGKKKKKKGDKAAADE
jgi:hypothetical protein